MSVIGLDVGGAHLKAADGLGHCLQVAFPLWKAPGELASQLRQLIGRFPRADQVVLTMTGELTECFASKREGVAFIVEATCRAADVPVAVYLVGDEFVEPAIATQQFMQAAASNWFGLATWAARLGLVAGRRGLLIDIGSTTTDIIPFADSTCIATGRTDFQRLVSGELVYTGAVRSPLNGILRTLHLHNEQVPVMNEWFANSLDAHIVLGHLPTGGFADWTADGRGTTLPECVVRLARLAGLDSESFSSEDARQVSLQVFDAQVELIRAAIHSVTDRTNEPQCIVAAGEGEFLATAAAAGFVESGCVIRLSELLDEACSRCAPAHAIANLWRTRKIETCDAPRLSCARLSARGNAP